MKERPILFSGEMVRAILDGIKTQTRRVVKPQPAGGHGLVFEGIALGKFGVANDQEIVCPYGKSGDRLWVRESWYECIDNNDTFRFVADGPPPTTDRRHYKRRASIHLPRRGARIILEITDIRIEQVQGISEDDAKAEGAESTTWALINGECKDISRLPGCPDERTSYRNGFTTIWQSINGKSPGKTWDDNPWVWVVTFEVVK